MRFIKSISHRHTVTLNRLARLEKALEEEADDERSP